jgi:adenine-specific DNA methylase
VQILHGTAAHLHGVTDTSVDLVCIDPPYYNNVQYAELSDFYYVWQRRTLADLYPDIINRRLTNKLDEAVANPVREGSVTAAKAAYERMMQEIFSECCRVLKDEGVMTLMFTHKSQDAWETLTQSLIESGWVITASFPVDSEFSYSQHILDNASAESSIIIICRKRLKKVSEPATWTGFGGTGVQHRIAQAVAEALPHFETLRLNPVDEMVASYGRALRVLSEQWPVLDGDEPVSPVRAMNEASRIVAERHIARLTQGRLQVNDLQPEAAMALTLYGVYGLHELPYDEALNLSRSLNIRLDGRAAGYTVEGRMIGINQDAGAQRRHTSREAESTGYHAPLVRKGSRLRLARPEERITRRLEHPQTEWDVLHGLIMAYRRGDIPVARAYLHQHAEGRQQAIFDLLHVWTEETPDEALRQEGHTMVFGLK